MMDWVDRITMDALVDAHCSTVQVEILCWGCLRQYEHPEQSASMYRLTEFYTIEAAEGAEALGWGTVFDGEGDGQVVCPECFAKIKAGEEV